MTQPFPWRVLDTLTRAEVSAMRDLRRWVAWHAQRGGLESTLAELLGQPVEVRVRRISLASTARAFPAGYAVSLAGVASSDRALLLLEGTLGVVLAAKMTGRQAPRVTRPDASAPAVAGALAALVGAVARRACAVPFRVDAAGVATDLAALHGGPAAMTVDATVLLGDDAYLARLVVSRDVASATPEAALTGAALAALGPVTLAIPVLAATWRTSAAEVDALGVGDVLLLPEWSLTRSFQGLWRGCVLLAAPEGSVGVSAELVEEGRLVLVGEATPVSLGTTDMSEAEEQSALVSAMGEVPVVVRVEIGEARMTAREWASAAAGDVIALGRKIGEPVVLRVSGVAVATGELVQIEGEVGVRILARAAGSGAGP